MHETRETRETRENRETSMVERDSFCTFHLGQLYLGVDVRSVQEVIRCQNMTRVPLARKLVWGLMNLRGQIVTAIDLREPLQLPPRSDRNLPVNVVVRTPEGPVSLLVDKIGDVVEIDRRECEPPPKNLSPAIRRVVNGVYKLEKRILLTIDIDSLVAPSETAC